MKTHMIAGLLCSSLTISSFATIIGEDDRKKVLTKTSSSLSIGVVYANFKDGAQTKTFKCTGSLISEAHILTAAHCVYKKEFGGYATDVSFLPSVLDSSRAQDQRFFVEDVWVLQRFINSTKESKFPNRNSDRSDLAVLKIDSHISQSLADKYGYQGYGFKWDSEERQTDSHTANFYSYPNDKKDKHGLWFEEGCKAFYMDDEVYASDCDTFRGASGGPLLLFNEAKQKFFIYGVNSGESPKINLFTRINQSHFTDIKNIVENNLQMVEGFTKKEVNSHPYFGINLKNICDKAIYVALHYLGIKEGAFVTRGFYQVPANTTINNIAWATDRYLGLYAQTYNAGLVWSGNDFSKTINGSSRDFYMEKLPATWTDKTFSFSCN